MGALFLFVFQVQTLYYSPDHKLVDGGLMIEGHSEVFGGEEDHLQFVQVHSSLCLALLKWSTAFCLAVCSYVLAMNYMNYSLPSLKFPLD